MNKNNMLLAMAMTCIVSVSAAWAAEADKIEAPYVLNKGFDTLLSSSHHGITINDVINGSDKLREGGCEELGEVYMLMMVQNAETGQQGVLAGSLRSVNQQVVASMVRDNIAENNAIIFPGRAIDRSRTRRLPIIVIGTQDIKKGDMVIRTYVDLCKKNKQQHTQD